MPGIPLATRETIQSRSGDQPCRHDSRVHLSAEEETAAEESLSLYCKPVELYNILQRRATKNPFYLQRCLHYKIRAKHQRRIYMTVSLSGTLDDRVQLQSLFPLHIMLARQPSDMPNTEHSAVYRYTKARVLTTPSVGDGASVARATFILPEINKLVKDVDAGPLFILFVSYGGTSTSCCFDSSRDNLSFSSSVEKTCIWGKIPVQPLFLSWKRFPNLNLGEKCEMLSSVDLHPCVVKSAFLGENCLSFQSAENASNITSQRLQVTISAEEQGARQISPYNPCTYDDVPSSSSSHLLRLRRGNVIFNYRYYHNKMQRSEVTEDFSCPFCLVKCACFQGLKLHLLSSHDLFSFEFWTSNEYQAVNVSVKTDPWRVEVLAGGVDPKQLLFFSCFRPLKRQTQHLIDKAKNVQALAVTSDAHAELSELNRTDDAYSSRVERARSSSVNDSQTAFQDPDCIQSIPGSSLAPPAMLQFAKTRKLSERSDSRSRALLEKRQFFHSHRAQPMALEQILSDHDSEDEVDDDVVDLEDRRMLDDFVDVTKDEKQIMHLWNSFVRKQRVLADGHIPWACEAFSRLHGHHLVQAPALIWCWRLFMIKLWNHGLLDARTMNTCYVILEQCQKQETSRV